MKLLAEFGNVFRHLFPGFPERLPFGQMKPWAKDMKSLAGFLIPKYLGANRVGGGLKALRPPTPLYVRVTYTAVPGFNKLLITSQYTVYQSHVLRWQFLFFLCGFCHAVNRSSLIP